VTVGALVLVALHRRGPRSILSLVVLALALVGVGRSTEESTTTTTEAPTTTEEETTTTEPATAVVAPSTASPVD